ncbi:uncharacterized protein LOC106176886 [Lingula anatina]|uniref:Uncharacterized protein LOC106176886 n=1 Tax=Lingula anatina TaxID=7574 RepID=A0A1S3JXY2_LINAN|nr:uncharacterized protein LOC106176886 [Lingula anatina]|eukprot:XP_013414911.1 uncharacterized protein LOC106176886 [Lingula anatina]
MSMENSFDGSCSSHDDVYLASDVGDLFPEITGVAKQVGGENTLQNVHSMTDQKTKVIQVKMSASEEREFLKYLSGEQTDENGQASLLKLVISDKERQPDSSTSPVQYHTVNSIMPGNANSNQGSLIKVPVNQNPLPPQRLCASKNAIAARENRQKRKKYVEGLQDENQQLKSQNETLMNQVESLMSTVKTLSSEVQYLQSVIANQSALSGLLKNIHNTPGVRFGTSLEQLPNEESPVPAPARKESKENNKTASPQQLTRATRANKRQKMDNNSESQGREETIPSSSIGNNNNNEQDPAGVCLHVSKGHVSLEFCATCSENSVGARKRKCDKDDIIVVDS